MFTVKKSFGSAVRLAAAITVLAFGFASPATAMDDCDCPDDFGPSLQDISVDVRLKCYNPYPDFVDWYTFSGEQEICWPSCQEVSIPGSATLDNVCLFRLEGVSVPDEYCDWVKVQFDSDGLTTVPSWASDCVSGPRNGPGWFWAAFERDCENGGSAYRVSCGWISGDISGADFADEFVEVTIVAPEGCVLLRDGQSCISPTEDDCCEEGGSSQASETCPESSAPINLLTGHKIERSTDLVVSLPGRDFELTREYTSDLDRYASNAGSQFWNGTFGSVAPGALGANWDFNAGQILQGAGLNSGTPAIFTLRGFPQLSPKRFVRIPTQNLWVERGSGNQWIKSSSASVYRRAESSGTFTTVEDSFVNTFLLSRPGGSRKVSFAAAGLTSLSADTFEAADLAGQVVSEEDEFGNLWYYEWSSLGELGLGFIDTVRLRTIYLGGTPGAELARVEFFWHGDASAGAPYSGVSPSDARFGRLAKVEVYRDTGSGEVVTQKVDYRYFDDLESLTIGTSAIELGEVYDASPGDLIEVVSSTLTSTAGIYHDRVWQYRYYGPNNNYGIDYDGLGLIDLTGREHQLMAVVYPEQMEFYADYLIREAGRQVVTTGTTLGDTPGLFTTYYDNGTNATDSVVEAAALLRWVRFENLASNNHPDASAMLLSNSRWYSLYDIAGKIISYHDFTSSSDPAGIDGRVKAQLVSSGDGSAGCGCGGTGAAGMNLGKRYDYVYSRYVLDSGIVPAPEAPFETNGFSVHIIESVLNYDSVALELEFVPYRVDCHDYLWPCELGVGEITVNGNFGSRANAVKLATAAVPANPAWDDPSDPVAASSGNRWATVYEYDLETAPDESQFNSYRKLTKKFTPSAVSGYAPANQSSANSSPVWSVNANSGLVHQYGYDSGGGWSDWNGVSKGSAGTVVKLAEYDRGATIRPDLAEEVNRQPGAALFGDPPQETSTVTRGFLGTGPDAAVAWERVQRTAETEEQNGPSGTVDYSDWRLWDSRGDLRWTRDAAGTLTYMEYEDENTGSMTLRVADAKAAGSYVDSTAVLNDTNFPGLSISEWSVPSRTDQAELEESYEYDFLGRLVRHEGSDGVVSFVRYELQTTETVSDDDQVVDRGVPYMNTVRFPHAIVTGSSYEFNGPMTRSASTSSGKSLLTAHYVVEPGSTGYDPLIGDFELGDLVAKSEQELSLSGVMATSRQWHDVAATPVAGSYVTKYEYDPLGRARSVIDPEGGVQRYGTDTEPGYDILDRPLAMSQGIESDPSSFVVTSRTYYDSGQTTTQGVGNGMVTRTDTYTGDSGDSSGGVRTTRRWYDFRDRLMGEAPPELPYIVYEYDLLGRVVEQATLADDAGFVNGNDGATLPRPSDDANRSTYTQTLYNNRGMVYRTRIAINPEPEVDPEEGPEEVIFLESNSWYDGRGLTIAEWSPNGPGTKTAYDALGRVSVAYVTDRFGDELPGESGNHADASSVSGNNVIEQTEYLYVANGEPGAGSAELFTHRMRLHNASTTGALGGTNSIATYTLYEFDEASRAFKTHAYGTNGTAFTKDTSAPNRLSVGGPFTSGALTSEVDFDLWGRQILSISPAGKKNFTVLDALSRQIAVVEGQALITADHIDLASGGGTWEVDWTTAYSGAGGVGPDDADRVTTLFYDGLGNVINRTAHLPNGSVQETEYDYGTTADSTPTLDTDSLISSSGLLRAVRYPNESTGLAGTTAAYTVTYGYNRLGELRGMSDQNGTTHAYTRDALGRVTLDTVTAFGTNIDEAVDAIATSYDDHGRVASVQSKDGSTVVNEVGFGYTKLHQIETLTQNAFGGVGGAAAKDVVYAYDNAIRATGSTGNYSRLASIRYPNEDGATDPTVEYGYGASGSIGDRIGRVAGMDVPGWTSTNTDLVDYTYLGGSTPVRVNYPSTTHGLGLDAIKAKNGTDGASTGTYYAFDKFGRVIHHAWVTDGFTTGTGSLPDRTPLFARAYEYDADSNRELDYDARPGAVRDDRDWEFQYDNLDRLKRADRGRGSGGFTLAADSQQWGLDILGNWKTFGTDANGNGAFENTLAERQNRTNNLANEITLQEKPNGMFSQILTQPAYDDAGNYLRNLNSTTARLTYKHDAWNRLVKIYKSSNESTGAVVLENQFNGLNWRVKRRMDLSQGAYNGADEARTYYYSANWQVLEEHVDTDLSTDGADDGADTEDDVNRIGQQFWGVRYIDDAVGRRVFRDTDSDGDVDGNDAGPSGFYYLTDVMYSARAITDSAGLLHTRLDYTPYGVAMHGLAADVNGDGTVSVADLTPLYTNANGGADLQPGATGYDPDAFLDGSDTVDTTAYMSRYTPYVSGGSGPTFNAGWIDNPGDTNGPDNSVGYDGYWFDLAGATEATSSGLYMVRHRVYDPRLGRWLQRDPLGYVDGMSMLIFTGSSPIMELDPLGLDSGDYQPGYGKDGQFVIAPHDENPRNGIAISIVFDRDRDALQKDACCDSLGFVQIYKTKKSAKNLGPPGLWHIDGLPEDGGGTVYPFYWLEDGTINYPGPGGMRPILVDRPSYLRRVGLFNHDQRMDFEVCAVCKSGPHRCQVYACWRWGWERKDGRMEWWVEGADGSSVYFSTNVGGVVDSGPHILPGGPPSPEMVQHLKASCVP